MSGQDGDYCVVVYQLRLAFVDSDEPSKYTERARNPEDRRFATVRDMKPIFDLEVYAARRARFLDGLENVAVVLPSAPVQHKSHDQHFTYRASNDLVYLTGFSEEKCVAVLTTGDDPKFVLFVQKRDPEREQWDGLRAGVDGALEHFGADEAFTIDQLREELPKLLENKRAVHCALNTSARFDRHLFAALDQLKGGRGKPDRAPDTIIDPRRRLHDQRRLKSLEELAIMRVAADIAAEAHTDAMRHTRPGQNEFEVAARIEGIFRRRGATAPGYDSIVGGGTNATILHYTQNDQVLNDGELVLIDAGAEYQFYNSDITRTFPVRKAFTPAQRDVYQAVLDVQIEAIERVASGAAMHDLTVWSRRATTEKLIDLGLLSGSVDGLVEEQAYKRFYMHNLGHYLGMDVHDVGTYLIEEGKSLPLEPGVVVTIEPGIYIPTDDDIPEAMRGIGIRIEDDILVTENGNENLTVATPKTVDEIEALRRDVPGS